MPHRTIVRVKGAPRTRGLRRQDSRNQASSALEPSDSASVVATSIEAASAVDTTPLEFDSEGAPRRFVIPYDLGNQNLQTLADYLGCGRNSLTFRARRASHNHPILAIIRMIAETFALYLLGGQANVVDIGGNFSRHARKNRPGIHCLCPLTPDENGTVIEDVSRHERWLASARNAPVQVVKQCRTDPAVVTYCNHRLEDLAECACQRRAFLSVDSIYYIDLDWFEKDALLGVDKAVVVYHKPPVKLGTQRFAEAELLCDGKTVKMRVAGGGEYQHKYVDISKPKQYKLSDGRLVVRDISAKYGQVHVVSYTVIAAEVSIAIPQLDAEEMIMAGASTLGGSSSLSSGLMLERAKACMTKDIRVPGLSTGREPYCNLEDLPMATMVITRHVSRPLDGARVAPATGLLAECTEAERTNMEEIVYVETIAVTIALKLGTRLRFGRHFDEAYKASTDLYNDLIKTYNHDAKAALSLMTNTIRAALVLDYPRKLKMKAMNKQLEYLLVEQKIYWWEKLLAMICSNYRHIVRVKEVLNRQSNNDDGPYDTEYLAFLEEATSGPFQMGTPSALLEETIAQSRGASYERTWSCSMRTMVLLGTLVLLMIITVYFVVNQAR